MKTTVSWLKEYVDIGEGNAIAETLNKIGFEVESVIDFGNQYEGCVIAEVISVSQHPNADRLKVCKVFDGEDTFDVLCGAPNVRKQLKVVLAKVGAALPCGLKIKPAEIRGVKSNGMLCSDQELGLSSLSEGIKELNAKAKVGRVFFNNDILIDIDITPNRGDCFSVYGIGRELAAAGIGKLKNLDALDSNTQKGEGIDIKLESTGCALFYGCIIKNIKIKGEKLLRIEELLDRISEKHDLGLVNISQYAMFSLGCPNHIYDLDKIKGNVSVCFSNGGEKFPALNGNEYTLPPSVLIVKDEEKILSVAGVIGGESSKVDENTKSIFIEVAHFDKVKVARAGRMLGVLSDARHRFEIGVDVEMVTKAVSFIMDCFGNYDSLRAARDESLLSKIKSFKERKINLLLDKVREVTGANITDQEILNILEKLHIKTNMAGDKEVKCSPASFRDDIIIPEDLFEEIIRIYGIEKITSKPFEISPVLGNEFEVQDKIASILCARGLTEIISWSLCPKEAGVIAAEMLEIENPINNNMAFLRTSLIYGMLTTAAVAMLRGAREMSIYEVGKVYTMEKEEERIGILRVGNATNKSVHGAERMYDFYDIKKDVLSFLQNIGLGSQFVEKASIVESYFHPYRAVSLFLGKEHIASFGVLKPEISISHGVKTKEILVAEIFLEKLPINLHRKVKKYTYIDFPIVFRDFAFVVDSSLSSLDLVNVLLKANKQYIDNVRVFDVYEGEGIPKGKKSIAVEVKILPQKVSLTDEEINGVCEDITKVALKKCNAVLR